MNTLKSVYLCLVYGTNPKKVKTLTSHGNNYIQEFIYNHIRCCKDNNFGAG